MVIDKSDLQKRREDSLPNETALLEEYKSCDELAKHIDKMIWQLAVVVFPIALAGLSFFGIASTHTPSQFIVIFAAAAGSVALLVVWHLLSNQWADYQKLTYYRMREIETELGLWHYRYAVLINKPLERRKAEIGQMDSGVRERFERLDSFFGTFRHFGYTRTRTTITVIFVLGWLALIVREAVLSF